MSSTGRWTPANLYQKAVLLYSALPRRLFPGGRAFPPWHYILEVTRRCNLRCAMCQYSLWYEKTPPEAQAEGELSTDEWRAVIDQTGRFSVITFTGGEPWVRLDFMDILEYASARARTHAITNGLRITPDMARACVDLAPGRVGFKGLNFLGVSLEGPAPLHDRIVRREGAFDRTTATVRSLVERRREQGKACPRVHMTVVIQEENVGALPEMAGIAADIGADVLNLEAEIRFHDLPTLGDKWPGTHNVEDVSLPRIAPEALRMALDETAHAARSAGVELRLPRMPRNDILRYYDGGIDLADYRCHAPWTNLYVGAKGDVLPCFIYRLGNVREGSLRSFWNGEKMRAFRRQCRERPFDICQGCCHLEHMRWRGSETVEPAPPGTDGGEDT